MLALPPPQESAIIYSLCQYLTPSPAHRRGLFRVPYTANSASPLSVTSPTPHTQIHLLHPRLPLLVRATGLTLVVVFALFVISAALPFSFRSSAWAAQLTSRIIDATSLGFVGVALLRFATLLEPWPDPAAGRREALRWARRRNQALGLARLG